MTIKNYYFSHFSSDLKAFMPDAHIPYFGHTWDINCQGLENISGHNEPRFLLCLYFTVLVDQAMHAHYRNHYQKFESLTRYPKFCHGLGQFHKNPRDILLVPIERGLLEKKVIDDLLVDAMSLFVDEVLDFCKNHMTEIDPIEFLDTLLYDSDVQVPLIVVLANPEMKHDTTYLLYDALKTAVDSKPNISIDET